MYICARVKRVVSVVGGVCGGAGVGVTAAAAAADINQ